MQNPSPHGSLIAVVSGPIIIRVLLTVNLLSAAAFAENAKDDAKFYNGRLTRNVFSEQVLSDKGLAVEQITFKLVPLTSASFREFGTGFDLRMFYQNENHVFAKLEVFQRTAEDGKTYAMTEFSQIYGEPDWGLDPSQRGKGIGSAIYLIAARLAKELWMRMVPATSNILRQTIAFE